MCPVFLALVLVLGAEDGAPVAMVLSAKGGVTRERGEQKPQPLRAMDLLRAGDRLAAGDGEAALVWLADGRRERLLPKAQATVGARGCTPETAVAAVEGRKLAPAQLNNLRELARSGRGAVGLLRSSTPPKQVGTPMYGATVLSDRPALTWPAVAKAESYRVELYSGDGRRLLWRATTQEPALAYPPKEKPLGRGTKCVWRVTARLGEGRTVDVVDSQFTIATRQQADELAAVQALAASPDAGDWLLAAAIYETHGVHDAALALYEKLAAKMPDEPNIQRALASYYERGGRLDEARTAREKAKRLGAGVAEK